MSDKPISVGDLVVVVRWPCCAGALGTIFRVAAFVPQGVHSEHCYKCNTYHGDIASVRPEVRGGVYPVAWLRRIPPMEELEGQHTQEKAKEPA